MTSEIYQDYKEWEDFKFPLRIINLRSLSGTYQLGADWVIQVWRDNDYKLLAIIEGRSKNREDFKDKDGSRAGTFTDGDIIEGSDGFYDYTLTGCVLMGDLQTNNQSAIDNSFQFRMSLHLDHLERTQELPQDLARSTLTRYEWYLCGQISILFPRQTTRKVDKIYSKVREGTDAEQNPYTLSPSGFARDYMKLETKDFTCLVAAVPEDYGPGWAKKICIEYRQQFTVPNPFVRKSIAELISFIFGSHLLCIGSTEIKGHYIYKQECESPWGDDVIARCGTPCFPPLELNDSSQRMAMETTINSLLPSYLHLRDPLVLNEALWKFWVAKELAIGVNLPILSSAIETIINSFLRQHTDISYTYLPTKKYLKLIKDEISSISAKLNNVDGHDRIINKIKSACTRGANEKMDIFFEKNDLPLGEIEREALRARNAMAHGGCNAMTKAEEQDLAKKTRAYETLFNRIILKLLGYTGNYIDYYSVDYPLRPIKTPTGGLSTPSQPPTDPITPTVQDAKAKKNNNHPLGLLRVAYNDYLAARVLLNKNHIMAGAMLASTAIEKYLKALISCYNGTKMRGHMDYFEEIAKYIKKIGYEVVLTQIDPIFLTILSKAYKLRYYDNIKEPTTIGFFKNQFLGELDGAVALFENAMPISQEGNPSVSSQLKRDYEAQKDDLFQNNWIALKIEKKKFMETDCEGFAVYIHPDNVYEEINVKSEKMTLPYSGSMILITLKNDADPSKI